MIKEKSSLPAGIFDGLSKVTVGAGFVVVKVAPLEVETVGDEFLTVIVLVPAVEMSDMVIVAFNRVVLIYSVVLAEPFQRTVELLLKLEPFTCNEKASLPARTLSGDREEIVGLAVGITCG
jgi:hypothetical protein